MHKCQWCGAEDLEWKRFGWVSTCVPGSFPPRHIKLCTLCVPAWEKAGCPDISDRPKYTEMGLQAICASDD